MDLQWEHRLTEVDDRSKSNQRRLEKVEKRQDALEELVASVKVLATRLENVEANVEETKTEVKSLTSKPAQKWERLIDTIVITVAAALIGFILAKIGM